MGPGGVDAYSIGGDRRRGGMGKPSGEGAACAIGHIEGACLEEKSMKLRGTLDG